MRRAKSLRIGVHHANAVVWGPVYRTHLILRQVLSHPRAEISRRDEAQRALVEVLVRGDAHPRRGLVLLDVAVGDLDLVELAVVDRHRAVRVGGSGGRER